jgi:pyruvate/2-oxoglutarate dehydrogenase complex dihydrolipoamide dehydrogenase (E3) component
VELAQAFARLGAEVVLLEALQRILQPEEPEASAAVAEALAADGVAVRTGVRALRARRSAGEDGAHVIELDDGSTAEGHVILLAVGRSFPIDDLGLEHYGIDTTGRTPFPRDGRLRVADGLWVVGDCAGPELHTHQAHYQGEMAVRMALGQSVMPDYRALPRATYTEPEASSVGVSLQQAMDRGLDAFELVADFAKSTKGYAIEATFGHITIVVDRRTRELIGAAIACPDASAAIHECVLAIKARVTIDVLTDTIHAFPSTSRTFQGLFADALKELDEPRA